jgi:outer membrane receptor protein involved in Fe transport
METTVDDYVRVDLRLGWQATEALEFSLVVQNLLENSHEEWNGFFSRGDRVPRAGYVKMNWEF